jgi:hypothetical protein
MKDQYLNTWRYSEQNDQIPDQMTQPLTYWTLPHEELHLSHEVHAENSKGHERLSSMSTRIGGVAVYDQVGVTRSLAGHPVHQAVQQYKI